MCIRDRLLITNIRAEHYMRYFLYRCFKNVSNTEPYFFTNTVAFSGLKKVPEDGIRNVGNDVAVK